MEDEVEKEETYVLRIHKDLKEDLDKIGENIDKALWDLGIDLGYVKKSLVLSKKLRAKGVV